jgi:flagellar motor switch protein FliM
MADILSQDEVDLLLSAVADGDISASQQPERSVEGPHLTTYDFRRPERVSKEQLKGLQSLFEALSREVSIMFPPFLRTVVRVDLVSIDQLTYDEFILSVARPTALACVNMAPLDGNAVIELSPGMIFPIIDRLLGGRGRAMSEPRELTEIETRIIRRIVAMILDSLRRSWDQLIEFQCSIVTIESDPLIVQIVAGSEMVVLVGYEVHIGDIVGSMNMCIPLMVLAPILDMISQQAHFMRKMSEEIALATRETISHLLGKALVNVDVILGEAVLPLSEVAQLAVGDVIQLNTTPEKPISVRVGGITRYLAQPGRKGEQSAIMLSGIVRD